MSGSLRIQGLFNVGKDAVVNQVNGRVAINFSAANTMSWIDKQGTKQTKTRWFDCALWRDNDKIAPYIVKGAMVYIEGVPDVKKFQRQTGETDATISINVEYIQILSKNPSQQQPAPEPTSSFGGGTEVRQDPADLPF